jgi:hypothetical protein
MSTNGGNMTKKEVFDKSSKRIQEKQQVDLMKALGLSHTASSGKEVI